MSLVHARGLDQAEIPGGHQHQEQGQRQADANGEGTGHLAGVLFGPAAPRQVEQGAPEAENDGGEDDDDQDFDGVHGR